jgi:predicted metal-dependent phosphoesterase TrpH
MWRRVDILLTDVPPKRLLTKYLHSYVLTLVHPSWISYTLKMEAIRSSETSVNKISIRRHIPDLQSHRRENLKSHMSNLIKNCETWNIFRKILQYQTSSKSIQRTDGLGRCSTELKRA